MSWSLVPATEADIDTLMAWFADAHSVTIWGGPAFRYPFTRETFFKDCHWGEFASFRLQTETGRFAAFGQLNERHDRSHLARLIANPAMRGQGVGKALVTQLLEQAKQRYDYSQCGLFVFRDNAPALQCYLSVGFEITEYPGNAPMPDKCYYLTKCISECR